MFNTSNCDKFPICEGIDPLRLLFCRCRVVNEFRLPMHGGMEPINEFRDKLSISNCVRLHNEVGIVDVRVLLLRLSMDIDLNADEDVGNDPFILLELRSILVISTLSWQ